MGFFGMGPGALMLDELKSKWESRKKLQDEDDAAIVTPPGEEPPKKGNSSKSVAAHLFDGTAPPSTLQKHPTSKMSQDAAHEYVTHPFLPVTNVSRTIKAVPISSTTSVEFQHSTCPPPKEIQWLSFMMHNHPQATTKQPE
jgi:hypothetical protein